MSKLHVLHLSDLHYSKVRHKDYDQGIILTALFEDIVSLRKASQPIDIIIFSGDLVYSGDDKSDFDAAIKDFIQPLSIHSGVPLEKIFIVPGNHDISRRSIAENSWAEDGMKTNLKSVQALNDFIRNNSVEGWIGKDAFGRVKNYETSMSIFANPILNTPFVKAFKIKVREKDIGIACFSTAWRSTGEGGSAEKGNILIGERAVDDAVKSLADCDVRLAVFHHPLSWLSDFDADSIRYRLEKDFSGSFCGHTHSAAPHVTTSETGASFVSQAGCLYENRAAANGYQIVTFDIDGELVEAVMREYDDRKRKFYPSREVPNGISFKLKTLSTAVQRSFTDDFIIRARDLVREKTMRHIVMIDEHAPTSINEAFICPPISEKSEKEAYARSAHSEKNIFIDVKSILESTQNLIVYGRKEGGKTSFAYYLALKCAEGVNDQSHIVPLIIDFKKLTKVKYKFLQMAHIFYEEHPEAKKIEHYLDNNSVTIILDNVCCSSKADAQLLNDIISHYPQNKWILLLDEELPTETGVSFPESLGEVKKVYLHSLQRKQIRKFTELWSERFDLPRINTFNSVMNYIENGDLPRTGYIVSLLLWAISKKKEAERVNEAVLIENIVEMMLGKADFRQALRAELDYVNKAFILRKIALLLKSKNNYATSNEVIQVIIDAFKARALDYDATDLYDGFIKCGILRKDADNSISFKYLAFQDYFIAKEIEQNKELYESIISDEKFLNYAREIELFTGINRENSLIILKIKSMVEKTLPERIARQNLDTFAQVHIDTEDMTKAVNELTELSEKKLYSDDIDDAVDIAEKRFANDHTNNKTEIPGFVQYLSLYGKIIRNLELNTESDKIEHVKFFFSCWIKLSMAYGEIIRDIFHEWSKSKTDKITEAQAIKVSNYVTNILLPIMLSFTASEQVGTRKLDSVLKGLARNETVALGVSAFSLFTLLDHKGKDWNAEWKDFLSKRAGSHISRLCVEKLIAHLSVTPMSEDEQAKFKQLIVDTGTGNKLFSVHVKSRVYDGLSGLAKSEEE